MEEYFGNEEKTSKQPTGEKNKMPLVGAGLTVAGPLILCIIAIVGRYDSISDLSAVVLQLVTFGFPVAGLVIAILCVSKWRNMISIGFKTVAIITIVLCNPFFLFIYYIICAMSTGSLAGQGMM